MIDPRELLSGARFFLSLPFSLRRRLTVQDAKAILRRRFEQRETLFLALVHHAIYQETRNPYRQLLDWAGCEFGDLEKLVSQDGIEGALQSLFTQGVYLTVEEFKGRHPVVRGIRSLEFRQSQLANSHIAPHVVTQSSGSRGDPSVVFVDFRYLREGAVDECLFFLDGLGGASWQHAIWAVPGGWTLAHLLDYSLFGVVAVRWFSKVDPSAQDLHPRYRWSGRALRWGSRLGGVSIPSPSFVPLDNPSPIARWMADVLRSGRTPHLYTSPSSAVRLCEAAAAEGISLHGARFNLGSEPTTAARLSAIEEVGARAVPRYGANGPGTIGYGCLAPNAPDDLHLLHDLHAIIQPGSAGVAAGLSPKALLFSSIHASTPLVYLNLSLGDQAIVAQRSCGCALEHLGWSRHLNTVRSFEKLTAAGMTFLDTDVIRILEEVLPARFGGGPTHYQLVEEEVEKGRPRMRLLIHPEVGPLNPGDVIEAFLTAIAPGSGVERVMGHVWRDGRFLTLERRAPIAAAGKILHLHHTS